MQHDLSLQRLIPIYLDALTIEGKSPKTITAYRESLDMYLRIAVSEQLPMRADKFTTPDVYRYIAAVRRRGVGDATQHRRHREMKHFFSWLKRMELVTDNPFQKVPLIRLEQKIIQPFTSKEIHTILSAYDTDTLLGLRNTAIVLVLLDTGVRASELTGFDCADIDFELGRARVLHGKGGKQRVIAFSTPVGQAIEKLWGTKTPSEPKTREGSNNGAPQALPKRAILALDVVRNSARTTSGNALWDEWEFRQSAF